MARVTVFVDDAVTGRLPDVCAIEGVPATGRTRFRREIGGGARLGVLWLLVLAGPIGWLALFLIAASRSGRGEVLEISVPMSDGAYERHRAALRARNGAIWLAAFAVIALVLGLAAPVGAGLGTEVSYLYAGLVAVALFGGAVLWGDQRAAATSVDIDLDASRRWVTLSGVHRDFAAACEQHQQLHARR